MKNTRPQDAETLGRIVEFLRTAGFYAIRTIPVEELRGRLENFPGNVGGHQDLSGRGTVIVAAFPCTRPGEPTDASQPGNPHALIAPFARRHYYREAVIRMKTILADLKLSPSGFRLFSNSSLPEKPIAAAAGLGFYGRNTLLISPALGSRFIIAGMITPLPSEAAFHPPFTAEPGFYCGSCRLCLEACPAGALDGSGGLDQRVCLQALSTEPLVLPEKTTAVWGKRLYGCDLCQDPCPFNATPLPDSPPITGDIGPSISIRVLLEAGRRGTLKEMLRGTALGLSWMKEPVFIRNALLAAGACGDASLAGAIESYRYHRDPILSETARYAAVRLRTGA